MVERKGIHPVVRREGSIRGSQVLERALAVLSLFTPDQPTWGLSELSKITRLPRSNVYRILRVFERHHFVSQDRQSKRFRLGSQALTLGWRALETVELRRIAHPVMERLAQATGETAILTIPSEDQTQSICIERVESHHPLRLTFEVGRRQYLHAGASSKILLAYLPPDQVERILGVRVLTAVSKNTITDPERLRAHLDEIRRRHYTVSFEETDEGAAGVAAPIRDRAGQISGGLGVAGPMARFTAATLPRLIRLVQQYANEVTLSLGGPTIPTKANVMRRGTRRSASTS